MPAEVTALDAGMRHGSVEWNRRWNPRNRVEGSYGILESLAVTNWGRSYHRFVGLARETLVAAFAMGAYNDHAQRSWAAKAALAQARTGPAVTTAVTETRPGSTAVNDRRSAAGSRRAPGAQATPKGMAFLAGGDPGPPG